MCKEEGIINCSNNACMSNGGGNYSGLFEAPFHPDVMNALRVASKEADFIESEFFAKGFDHAEVARAARRIYLAANGILYREQPTRD
jgi:hypothetical protein